MHVYAASYYRVFVYNNSYIVFYVKQFEDDFEDIEVYLKTLPQGYRGIVITLLLFVWI